VIAANVVITVTTLSLNVARFFPDAHCLLLEKESSVCRVWTLKGSGGGRM